MKKILYSILIAGLTLASAACQKVDEKSAKISGDRLKVTATIASFDGTKVNYAFTDGAKSAIKPTWSEGDEIFGFDDKGGTFTFTVTSVDTESRRATFKVNDEYAPEDGTVVYGVYYPGKDASDFVEGELAVDITSQTGVLGNGTPVIMCATATVSDGAISFEFANQTAIVGIYRMQIKENDTPVSAGVKISGVSIKGVCAKGTIKVDGGELKLIPGSETETISATGLELTTVANGFIEVGSESIAPYFSVIPGASTMSVEATSADKTYYNVSSIASADLTAGNYYYIGKVLAGPVAYVTPTGLVAPEYYGSLQEAVVAANNSDEDVTITMLEDVTVTSQLTINNANEKTVTLDLNDCTISGDLADAPIFDVSSSLTVTDEGAECKGSIENTHQTTKSRTIFLNDVTDKYYKFTVNGGTFRSCADKGVVYCMADEVEINGGSFINKSSAGGSAFYMYLAAAKVTINDGNFVDINGGEGMAFRSGSSTVTINGGYFYNGSSTKEVVSTDTGSNNNTRIIGGKYSKEPASKYLAAGYQSYTNSEQKTIDGQEYDFVSKVDEATTVVAKIGTKEYVNIKDAFDDANAAESDVTLTILNNAISVDSIIVNNASSKITLDLNGKELDTKLTIESEVELVDNAGEGVLTYSGDAKFGCPVLVYPGGEFTMTSGKIVAVGTTNYDNAIRASGASENSAIVNINGGTLSGDAAYGTVYGSRAEITAQNVTITGRRCFFVTTATSLTVNSGIYSSEESTLLNSCIHSGASTVVIKLKGGDFSAGTGMFSYYNNTASYGDVTITGGRFKWADESPFSPNAHSKLKPQGGVYTQDISSYIQGMYACVENTDPVYGYKVVESTDNSILQVGTTKYETVAEAMEAVNSATSPVTIKLLKNIDLAAGDSLAFTNSETDVTLDLNDFTLKSTSGASPVNTCAKNLTITSPTTNGTINQATAATCNALFVTGGTCNITGGTITHSNGTGYYLRTAIIATGETAETHVNITGGKITAGGRVISFGSGASARKVYVNISGGLIQSRTTVNENSSGTVSYVNSADYSMVRTRATNGFLTVTGGTFHAYYQPIFYTNYNSTKIVVKKDGDSVPYLYQAYPDWTGTAGGAAQTGTIFKAYSATTAAYYEIDGCYTNAKNVSHEDIYTKYGSTVQSITPIEVDDRSYKYYISKIAEE